MKMNGFTSINIEHGNIKGIKPKWQSQGASLKRNFKSTT
jgi:hypothetical protein